MSNREHIGRTLRDARVRSGLSAEEAAKLIGVTRMSIRRWEGGKTMPDADHYLKLIRIYAPDDEAGLEPAA